MIRFLQNGEVRSVNACRSGSDSEVTFEHPTGLAADDQGNLYAADTFADTICRIHPAGEITTEATGLPEPMGTCWQTVHCTWLKSGNNRVVSVKNGQVIAVAGSGEAPDADRPAKQIAFCSPQGVAAGSGGTIYVADAGSSAVRFIQDGQVPRSMPRTSAVLKRSFQFLLPGC